MAEDAFFATSADLNPHVFALVQQLQGSVSTEHGAGIVKRDTCLPYSHPAHPHTVTATPIICDDQLY